jgi:hypothetical protein
VLGRWGLAGQAGQRGGWGIGTAGRKVAGTGRGSARVSIVTARTRPPRPRNYASKEGKEGVGKGAKGRNLAGHQGPVSKRRETGQGADARGRVPIIFPVILIILIILNNLVIDTKDTRNRGV